MEIFFGILSKRSLCLIWRMTMRRCSTSWCFAFLVGVVFVVGGCATFGFRNFSLAPPKVLVPLGGSENIDASIICVLPFSSQEKIPELWLRRIGETYARSLQVKNIGAMVRFFDAHRDFIVHRKECHLLLEGSVERMVATGGGQPQEIALLVQIRELATDRVIFSVLQEGISHPGEDVDLYWSTRTGETGYPMRKLIEAVSDQFGAFLKDEMLKNSRKGF
jgi:hypothetical protein